MPDIGAGCCLDQREMGSAWGKGVREGPAPQADSAQQGQRQHGQGRRRTGKSGVMKKDQCERVEPFFLHKMGDHIINVNYVY